MEPQKSIVLPLSLAILASAIVFGGLGYYFAINRNTTGTTTATPTYTTTTRATVPATVATTQATASPTSATPQSTTSDEKTYNNTGYGVSFNYPSDWTVSTANYKDEGASLYVTLIDTHSRYDNDLPDNLRVGVYSSVKSLDTKNLGATTLKDYLDKYAGLSDPIYQNVKAATFGGKNGYSADAGPNRFGGGAYYFAPLTNGSVVKAWYCVDSCSSETTNINNIISSFKFTK